MSVSSQLSLAFSQLDHEVSLARGALAFTQAGIPVFPCVPGGKRPALAGGFRSASSDPHQIEHWWRAMPAANIGMPTGAPSGVAVVDVDVHGPTDGYEALDRAQRAGLIVDWFAAVETPSGGLHLFFPADTSTSQRSWQCASAGIDFRGDGGYVIVPPSSRMVDGRTKQYEILQAGQQGSRPFASHQLRNFLDPSRANSIAVGQRATEHPIDSQRLGDWVARLQEGERNHGLFWAACKMADQRISPAETLDVLGAAAGRAGLCEREILTTIRSAYRTVTGTSFRQAAPSSALITHDRTFAGAHTRELS